MKKSILIILSVITCLAVILWPETSAHSNGSGAPTGYTGSPNDFSGRTCSAGGGCHNGGATAQTGWVTSTVPACGYAPGQTYSVTVSVTSTGRTKFGFSASPQTAGGTTAGTLISAAGMQINGAGRYITHTSAGTAQTSTNSRTWTFQWTAPAAGTGTVTFYAAMNATNSSNSSAGDMIYSSSLAIGEAPTTLSLNNNSGTVLCDGASTTLSSNLNTGNVWTLGASQVGTGATLNASSAGTYTLINTTNGCIQTQNITLSTLQSPLTPTIDPATPTMVCDGETVVLTSSAATGIVWSPNGETTSTIDVTESGFYSVSVSNACGTAVSEDAVITFMSPSETPVIEEDRPDLCAGTPVTLTASNATFFDNVVWQPGNLSGPTIEVTEAGTYTATYSNVCGTSEPGSLDVIFFPLPETPVITLNAQLDLESSVSGSNYEWFLDGVLIDGAESQTWTPSATGIYTVIVTGVEGCISAVSAGFEVSILSIAPQATTKKLQIFPNPSSGLVQISMNENGHPDDVQLFDFTGKHLKTIPAAMIINQPYALSCAPGIYLVRSGSWSATFVVE